MKDATGVSRVNMLEVIKTPDGSTLTPKTRIGNKVTYTKSDGAIVEASDRRPQKLPAYYHPLIV